MADQSGYHTLWEGVLAAVRSSPMVDRPPHEAFSETLQRVVARHIAQEESSIERYRQLRQETKDPVVKMLIGELLGDEEQHHDILRRMEAQLLAELGEVETPEGAFTGYSGDMSDDERRELVDATEELAEHEANGAKHLQDIADDARKAGSDVLGLLLDSIAMDSRKHERILKFIGKRVADS